MTSSDPPDDTPPEEDPVDPHWEPGVDPVVPGPRAIAARVVSGDQEAISILVSALMPTIQGVMNQYDLPNEDRDDIVQTVLLKLFSELSTRQPEDLEDWVSGLTSHESRRILRANELRRGSELGGERGWPGDAASEPSEWEEAFAEALQHLPPRQRRLLELLLQDPPLSYEEVGARLGIPVGAVGPTRARALQTLRQEVPLRRWTSALG